MEIKYFVRTTGDRVLDESFNRELGNDYLVLIDKEHKPVKSLIEQLNIINEYDSVLLEDDVILCKDFKNKIEEAIKEHKDKIINFFGKPRDYFKTREECDFHFLQCRYYPKGVASILANELEPYIRDSRVAPAMNKVALKLNLTLVQYRPCLVQHLDIDTLVNNRAYGLRRTPYFVDYLDELEVNYDEASIRKNKIRKFIKRKIQKGEIIKYVKKLYSYIKW